ncbi:MAG TPA: hypothetical protein VFF04_02060 [Candidatus Babeliales bacterium]|nr:hypothetical protein [Candidatus Babeliales bacterium]
MKFDMILTTIIMLNSLTMNAANQAKYARDYRHLQKALFGNVPQKVQKQSKMAKSSTAENRLRHLMGHLLTSSNQQKKS